MQPFLIIFSQRTKLNSLMRQRTPFPSILPLATTPDQLVISGDPAAPHENAGGRRR